MVHRRYFPLAGAALPILTKGDCDTFKLLIEVKDNLYLAISTRTIEHLKARQLPQAQGAEGARSDINPAPLAAGTRCI
jgi:hypothetical protein